MSRWLRVRISSGLCYNVGMVERENYLPPGWEKPNGPNCPCADAERSEENASNCWIKAIGDQTYYTESLGKCSHDEQSNRCRKYVADNGDDIFIAPFAITIESSVLPLKL